MDFTFFWYIKLTDDDCKYMNAADPKKTVTPVMWELQVLKTMDLSSVEQMRMLVMMKIYEVKMVKVGVQMFNVLRKNK